MTKKRELFVVEIPNDENKQLKNGKRYLVGEVYYSLGGMNMFSGGTHLRGYYFSAGPEERGDGTRAFTMLSATAALIKEASRFNSTTLETLNVPAETVRRCVARSCEKARIAVPSAVKAWTGEAVS